MTRTALWRSLAPRDAHAAHQHMPEVVALSVAGMNTLPFGGGHALAVGLLIKRAKLRVDSTAALIGMDQFFEGVAKVTLLELALLVAPLPGWMEEVVAAIGVSLLIVLPILAWLVFRNPADPSWLKPWSASVQFLRRPSVWLNGIGWSLGGKVAEALGILAVQHACGVELPWTTVVLVVAAVNIGTLISVAPGDLGVYEAAAFAAYTLLGLPHHLEPTATLRLFSSHDRPGRLHDGASLALSFIRSPLNNRIASHAAAPWRSRAHSASSISRHGRALTTFRSRCRS